MSPQTVTFAEAARSAVEALVQADPSLVILRESSVDAPPSTLLMPVADRASAGVAYGLALAGRKVVLELADSSRLPAIVEVVAELGAIAQLGEFQPVLVVRVPYGQEAIDLDVPVGRWFVNLPGVSVVCPTTAELASGLLRSALTRAGITIVLEPRALTDVRSAVTGAPVPFAARWLRTGDRVTLASWGAAVELAAAAAETLAGEGIEADLIDLVALSPLDTRLLGERVRATGRLVIVHPDDPSFARRIREVALEEAFLYLEAPLADIAASARREGVVAAVRATVGY